MSIGLLIAGEALAAPSGGRLVSETVGIVNREIVSSRDMALSIVLESAMTKKSRELPKTKDDRIQAVNTLLLDRMIESEAKSLGFRDFNKDEIEPLVSPLEKDSQDSNIKPYNFTKEELRGMAGRKIIVRNFLRSKSGSFESLLSDQDLKAYYDKNRLRFGTVSFEQIKDNIRAFLTSQQREDRMIAWIGVLKTKYKARNYLVENQQEEKKTSSAQSAQE
jgi:hypothetical protein